MDGWLLDSDTLPTQDRQPESVLPTRAVQKEITAAIEAHTDSLVFEMEWQKGDMVINDNLGLAHYAVPGTQGDRNKVGECVVCGGE